jgi:putative inorganic carbon (hco3(-)) transporter
MATIPLPAGATSRGISPWLALLPVGLALALLPPAVTGPLVLAAAGAAVLLARPRWALYLLALTVPYQSGFRFGEIGVSLDVKVGQLNVSVTEGVVLLLLVGWVTQLAAGRAPRPAFTPLLGAMAVLLCAITLSGLVATDLSLAAKELLKWVELGAVYAAGMSLLQTPGQRRTLLAWLLAAGTSQALVGLVQSVQRIGPEHFLIGGVLMRAYGTFEQPNPFGGYLGLHLPLIVALVCFGHRRRTDASAEASERSFGPSAVTSSVMSGLWRKVATISAALIGIALVITLSRGAWTAQVVALLIVILGGSRMARTLVMTFGVLGLILGIAVWPLLPAELSARLVSVVSSAVDLGGVRDAVVTPENWAVMDYGAALSVVRWLADVPRQSDPWCRDWQLQRRL